MPLILPTLAPRSRDTIIGALHVEDWLGVPMFFSSSDPDADRELFRDAGLAIRLDETVVQHAPEGDLPFHWTLAQKSNA